MKNVGDEPVERRETHELCLLGRRAVPFDHRCDPFDQFGKLAGATTEVHGVRHIHLEVDPGGGMRLGIEDLLGSVECFERQVRVVHQTMDPSGQCTERINAIVNLGILDRIAIDMQEGLW